MIRVSIVGASGLVGARLLSGLRDRAGDRLSLSGTGFRRPGPGLTRLDVTDAAALDAHLAAAFDVVIYAAGTKDVAGCERDPALADALNAEPVEEMVRIIARRGLPTRLVLLSTDYVFDGERGSYRATDAPAPRTHYGRSKARAERAVLAAPGPHRVVRSAALLGRGARFFDWLRDALEAGREVALFEDCHNSPTPIGLLVDAMAGLLLHPGDPAERVVHAVGDRRMSRLETGRLVATLLAIPAARLVPARRAAGGPLFQRDLSMVPSDRIRSDAPLGLEGYLRRELREAAGAGGEAPLGNGGEAG